MIRAKIDIDGLAALDLNDLVALWCTQMVEIFEVDPKCNMLLAVELAERALQYQHNKSRETEQCVEEGLANMRAFLLEEMAYNDVGLATMAAALETAKWVAGRSDDWQDYIRAHQAAHHALLNLPNFSLPQAAHFLCYDNATGQYRRDDLTFCLLRYEYLKTVWKACGHRSIWLINEGKVPHLWEDTQLPQAA